jgi:hypothetical protein
MAYPLSHIQLKPSVTLSEVFGRNIVFSSCISPNACAWLSLDNSRLDLMSGSQLAMSGAMPFICAHTVSTKEALQLLIDAGLETPDELYQYKDPNDYLNKLSILCRQGKVIAFQHVHTTDDAAPENCWIKPSILSFVNNKAYYKGIVDEIHLLHRSIFFSRQILDKLSSFPMPIVIKAATDESTGSGHDVCICRRSCDLNKAEKIFHACSRVIVEEFLEINRNLCLNYAVTSAGRIIYLGSAEQVSDAEGKYRGNWIDPKGEAPPEAVELGRNIVQKSYGLGYRGFVGIDMAVQDNGSIIVFDLNFRVCGSTFALVMAEAIRQNLGQSVIRSHYLIGKGTYSQMLKVIYKAMEKKLLVPFASYDPSAGLYSSAPLVRCLILGQSREEVEENQQQIAEWGLTL